MRIFTMLFLPGMLLGCGKAISAYDPYHPGSLDLSVLGLNKAQLELLSRRLAIPYYSAAAIAMFVFALLLSLFHPEPWLMVLLACTIFYLILQMGTLAYLYHVVKQK